MSKELTKEILIADIKRVARIVGHSPTYREYRTHGKYSAASVHKYVADTWADAIAECGLLYKQRVGKYRILTNDELKKDVERVARELGKPPTRTEYMKLGMFDDGTVADRTEAKRWPEALVLFLNLDIEEAKKYGRNGEQYRTTEERLQELRDLARKIGHVPSIRDTVIHHFNAPELRKRINGTWEDVIKAAGLQTFTRRKITLVRNMSNEQILADIRRVARQLGYMPTYREYKQFGRVSSTTVDNRFGSWGEAIRLINEKAQSIKVVKAMGEVQDPMRDMLKEETTDAIRDFFRNKNQKAS